MTDAQAIFYIFQISKAKRLFPTVGLELATFCSLGKQAILPRQEDNCLPMVLIYKVQPCTFHLFIILVGFVASKSHVCYLLGGDG